MRSSLDTRAARDVRSTLDDGLAIARRTRGWTFIAVPAPMVSVPAIVAACRPASLVAWCSRGDDERELAIVGIGVARELRGKGAARWTEVATSAAQIERG